MTRSTLGGRCGASEEAWIGKAQARERSGWGTPPNFITLGPAGSCHERATRRYIRAIGLPDRAHITFVDDLVEAVERLDAGREDYIVQCSAHLNVHQATERRSGEVHVVDTFICPTRPIAILARRDVANPRTIGVPHAAVGYLEGEDWGETTLETTKPVVGLRLLEGVYDAGLTNYEQLEEHPQELRLVRYVGEVQTTWLVYGGSERESSGIVLSCGAKEYWKGAGGAP
jgi:hypothetical protein